MGRLADSGSQTGGKQAKKSPTQSIVFIHRRPKVKEKTWSRGHKDDGAVLSREGKKTQVEHMIK